MFLHSVQVQEQAISADGLSTFDLAVNPLSVVLLHLKPLNDTGTLSEFASFLNVCGAMNRVSVLHQGVAVVSVTGRDLAALNYFRHGIVPPQASHAITNNDRRSVVLPILLGRHAYDPKSCFPASRRGELVLEIDFDIADTGYDGLRFGVETIELLNAKPKEYERTVQNTGTFAAGVNDVELPVGNIVRGLLLFGTTGFTGAAPAPSWGRIETLVDNQQVGFGSTDFEVAHMVSSLWGRQPPMMDGHIHTENDSGGPTDLPHLIGSGGWGNYAFLDFDPSQDGMFELDLSKAQRFQARADAETADAFRVVTVEAVKA